MGAESSYARPVNRRICCFSCVGSGTSCRGGQPLEFGSSRRGGRAPTPQSAVAFFGGVCFLLSLAFYVRNVTVIAVTAHNWRLVERSRTRDQERGDAAAPQRAPPGPRTVAIDLERRS